MKTDVLIVGAGPTGLSLACQFVRYGIDFVIVEKNEGITPYSKAIGVQARTLEIFEQIELAQRAVEGGTIAGKGRLLIDGRVRGEFDFSNIGKGFSPFPFVLMLEQSKTESLLYDYLRSNQKDVLWKTTLETFSQDDRGVTAVVTRNGQSETIEAKYLIGCDGAKSSVREALGLTFGGSTDARIYYVADAQVEWDLGHDALHICFSKGSFVVFFPLKGEKRFRIVGVFPQEFSKEEGEILYDEIEARIRGEAKLPLDIHDVAWFSTYKVHTRHVNEFSSGRGFLAGDAAHIHTPVGAQGMNTGIQDAYNLAWKMALVIRREADERLLETYNEERLENAKRLLKTTDRLFQIVAGTDWLTTFLRTEVLPLVSKQMFSFGPFKAFLFPILSQTGIHYRGSSLSDHSQDGRFKVQAGDRMPYLVLDGRSIYERLHAPKFHLLLFSDGRDDYQELKSKFAEEYGESVGVLLIPLYPHVADIFGVERSLLVLLRPDNHIGLLTTEMSIDSPRDYLRQFIGSPAKDMAGA